MEPTLRSDMDVTIFRVETFWPDERKHYAEENCWGCYSDSHVANVPKELRYTKEALEKRTGSHRQPFHDFTASGEVWQQTGFHGTTSKSHAVRMAELLAEYNPGIRFRVVKHRALQERTQLAEFVGDADDDKTS